MKHIKQTIIAVFVLIFGTANAQIDFRTQLDEIPPMVSNYVDFLMYDITNYQGATYLNNMSTTGKVLDQWELKIGVNVGTALVPGLHSEPLMFSENFEINGSEPSVYWSGPNLFGSTGDGDIFFRFLDEYTNGPVYHPFTGEKIGFAIPLIAGLGTGVAFSPAIMPEVSLGVGYGTEITVSAMPGALKPVAGALPIDFSITKDFMYAVGLKHDVFSWIPQLNEQDFHLSLGVNYTSLQLGLELGEGLSLFGDLDNQSEYYTMQDNFKGINYGSGGLGFEAIATKSFGWVDLSLFASTNQSSYSIQSEGDLLFSVATSFVPGSNAPFEDYAITNIVNVEKEINSFLYGAAAQLNLGGFGLGIKYAHQSGAMSDEGRRSGTHYIATSLSYAFSLVKDKSVE